MLSVVNYISIKLFNSIVITYSEIFSSSVDINTVYSVLNNMYPDNKDLNKTLVSDIDTVISNVEEGISDFNQLLAYMYPKAYNDVINARVSELTTVKRDIVLGMLSIDEFNNKLLEFINGNHAIDTQTSRLITTYLINYCSRVDVDSINIKTVKYSYIVESGVLPKDPNDFLIVLAYIATKVPMLVKDKHTLEMMHLNADVLALHIIKYCNTSDGIDKLASVFYRNKSLFMSIKTGLSKNFKNERHLINLIRRKAIKHHNPVKEALYKRVLSEHIPTNELIKLFTDMDTTYLIKILSGVTYRILALNDGYDKAMYRIRNGNSKIDTFSSNLCISEYMVVYDTIKDIVRSRIVFNINKYNIVFENTTGVNIDLGIPVNAKQLVGNLPYGTTIEYSSETDVMFGIYWTEKYKNYDRSVDLDLSLTTTNYKIGWDGDDVNDDGTIIYSGDVVSATNGASEVIYINKVDVDEMYDININNYSKTEDIDFVFSIANTIIDKSAFNKNYFMDEKDVKYSIPIVFPASIPGMKIGNIYNDGVSTVLIINSSGNKNNIASNVNIDASVIARYEMVSKPTISDMFDITDYPPKHDSGEVVIDVSNPNINNLMLLVK